MCLRYKDRCSYMLAYCLVPRPHSHILSLSCGEKSGFFSAAVKIWEEAWEQDLLHASISTLVSSGCYAMTMATVRKQPVAQVSNVGTAHLWEKCAINHQLKGSMICIGGIYNLCNCGPEDLELSLSTFSNYHHSTFSIIRLTVGGYVKVRFKLYITVPADVSVPRALPTLLSYSKELVQMHAVKHHISSCYSVTFVPVL